MGNGGVTLTLRTLGRVPQTYKRRKGPQKQGFACAKAWRYKEACFMWGQQEMGHGIHRVAENETEQLETSHEVSCKLC